MLEELTSGVTVVMLAAEISPLLVAVTVYCPAIASGTLEKSKLATPEAAVAVWFCEKAFGPVIVTVTLALEVVTRLEPVSYTPTLIAPMDDPADMDAGGGVL